MTSNNHRGAAAILNLLTLTTLVLAIPTEARPRTEATALEPANPFLLDSEIARYLARRVKPSHEPEARLQALLDVLFDKEDGLGITYGNQRTLDAIQTFHSRSGNCLSFTLLFVSMARHVGLRAYFKEVAEVTSWDRRGELVVVQQHMFAEVEIRNGHVQVDFLPGAEKRYRHLHRIDDERALAHFYNNLGVEQLTVDDLESATKLFHRSLEHDPRFTPALSNLGVCQRRQGDFAAAEATYRAALAIEPQDATALSNLASLYLARGRPEEAEPLLAKAEEHLNRNPYYHYRRGVVALAGGDAAAAVRHLQQAIRRQDSDPELYSALAEAWRAAGDLERSAENLERARQLTADHPKP